MEPPISAYEPDYYHVLQVSPEAEQEVIEAAYRRLARKYHPDVNKDPAAGERMRLINTAFAVLGDPVKRAEYDARKGFSKRHAGQDAPRGPSQVGCYSLAVEGEKTTLGTLAALLRRAIRRIGRRDLVEAALVGFAFLLYFLVRGSVIDRPNDALQNAMDVIDAERRLGIFWEPHMQDWIMGNRVLVQVSNYVYFWLHFPLIIAFGLVLYFADRHKYTVLRDAFLASGAISLIIYGLYPVAPPRLLPELADKFNVVLNGDLRAFVDTMNVHLGYGYQAQSMQPFVNPYAAVPSLHFGWDFLLGGGIIWAFRRYPVVWPVGLALPVMQLLAIAVTANHYFLDALIGMEVALIGLVIAVALQRWAYAPLGRLVSRVPWLARSEEEKARPSPV